MADTIYALSTGSPPAGIAVIRISGPAAADALRRLAGRVPKPRRASAATLRHPQTGETLDRGLVLHFPGPATATGEEVGELHLHGGRAVVAGVLAALACVEELRPAGAGEFTRRAFENGRIDLAEAEGLADLLSAETEAQRRAALALAGGALSRRVEEWQRRLLALSGQVEAALDFSEEEATQAHAPIWEQELEDIVAEVGTLLSRPALNRLKEGTRVVIAGPPNVGKSTLLNALAGRDAAITSPIPGTTRDVVEAPTTIGGAAFLLIDTAGLRQSGDEIEAIGVQRAKANMAAADLILWLGDPKDAPAINQTICVQAKADLDQEATGAGLRLSARTGAGLDKLFELLLERSAALTPQADELAINTRHREALAAVVNHVDEAISARDVLIVAEALRQARAELDKVTGRAGVEDMLDSLFKRFCIGK